MFLTMSFKQQVIDGVRDHIQGKIKELLGSGECLLQEAAAETQQLCTRDNSDQARYQLLSLNESLTKNVCAFQDAQAKLKGFAVVKDSVQEGALVVVAKEGAEYGWDYYFFLDGCAGVTLRVDGRRVTLLSPSADRGKALMGKTDGSLVKFRNHDANPEDPDDVIYLTVIGVI